MLVSLLVSLNWCVLFSVQNSKQLIGELLPAELSGAVVELNVYFIRKWLH